MIKLVLCALGLTAITVIIHGVGALASGRLKERSSGCGATK